MHLRSPHATAPSAGNRASRRSDPEEDHRVDRFACSHSSRDRRLARSQPTGDEPAASASYRCGPAPLDVVATRSAQPLLRPRSSHARTDHGVARWRRRRPSGALVLAVLVDTHPTTPRGRRPFAPERRWFRLIEPSSNQPRGARWWWLGADGRRAVAPTGRRGGGAGRFPEHATLGS
jgi:hypothetical protein